VGGNVPTLLSLLLGGLLWRLRGKSIGMLLVPAGRDLTARAARMAVTGAIAPHLEGVLPLSAVPEALRRTGQGMVRGKLVIRPDLPNP
jgi:NADPH:quinone reductase-like Zn-dependent oxidoreductase